MRLRLISACVMSLALALGCVNVFPIGAPSRDGGEIGDAGDGLLLDGGTFGDWAASIGLPGCPDGSVIVVDTVEDELDAGVDFATLTTRAGAGAHLSLREALWLARNTAGPKSIVFDEQVFPARAPGVMTISSSDWPWNVPEVCLDGRSRGVIIRWEGCFSPVGCVWSLDSKSRMLGLTLEKIPQAINLSGQVAASRLSGGGRLLNLQGSAVVGPGVIFGPCQVALQAESPTSSVKGSYFGLDPLTKRGLAIQVDMYLFEAIDVRDSEFHSVTYLVTDGPTQQSPGSLTRNTYEDATVLAYGGQWFFANNRVRGTTTIHTMAPGTLQLSRNSIAGQTTISSPVPPPTLLGYSNGTVTGFCPLAGQVEVFSDLGSLGETFVGEKACAADAGFSVDVQVAAGLNITATLSVSAQGSSGFSTPLTVQ